MFIRQTKTGSSSTGKTYHTYRLVTSERFGAKVRQRTLLNLGKDFSLPREHWPTLCARIEEILSGQLSLAPAREDIEKEAQRCAAIIVAKQPSKNEAGNKNKEKYQEIDLDSLELIRPRSIGVEHAGLAALEWLGLTEILEEAGLNGAQRAAALGAVIGRMACPGSELSTWRWLQNESGLGELLSYDFDKLSLMRLYRTSDPLIRKRFKIEESLFQRITNLLCLSGKPA